MDAVFYWDMTFGEIIATIKAHNKRLEYEVKKFENEARMRAFIAYKQADITAAMVAKVFGGKGGIPALHEAFPNLFEAPKIEQQNWKVIKDRIAAFAAAQRKRGGKIGDNSRGTTGTN